MLLRGLLLCGALAAPSLLLAQDPPAEEAPTQPAASSEPKKPQREKSPPSPDAGKPAPAPATSTREFKPSEAVSSDQEVDFPADL